MLLQYASSQCHSCVSFHVQACRLPSFSTDRTMLLRACLLGLYYISLYNNLYNIWAKWKRAVCLLLHCCRPVNLSTLPFINAMYVNCITSVICMCIYRRRRQRKNRTFLHFNQPWPWTLNRFTENDPVALADVLDPSADGMDQVDLHVDLYHSSHIYFMQWCLYLHINYIHVYNRQKYQR